MKKRCGYFAGSQYTEFRQKIIRSPKGSKIRLFWQKVKAVKNPSEYVGLWEEFLRTTKGRKLSDDEIAVRAFLEPRASEILMEMRILDQCNPEVKQESSLIRLT